MATTNPPNTNGRLQSLRSTGQRLPWLAVTLGGGLVMAELVTAFAGQIAAEATIAGFIPVMTGLAGNVAIQAATISVVAVNIEAPSNGKLRALIAEEIRVGALLGLAFAVVAGGYAALRFSPHLGLAVGVAATLELLGSALIGMLIPVVLNRLGIHAPVATGPIVTTLVDIAALGIYLTTCSLVMQF